MSAGDPRDYILDLGRDSAPKPHEDPAPATSPSRGDSLSIHFTCCNVYHRIALTRDGTAYAGHCPRCARPIRVLIDPNSPNTGRFFRAG